MYARRFGKEDEMPVRTVITRRSNHFRCSIPSLKNGQPTPCESILEGLLAKIFELSPLVESYEWQPIRLDLFVDGERRRYTPDFLVNLTNGNKAWFEVKPAARLIVPRVSTLMDAAKVHFRLSRDHFQIVTDEWLHAEPRAGNVNELMYYRRGSMTPIELANCNSRLAQHRPRTLAELCSLLGKSDAWLLLGLGIVGVDLDQVIEPGSNVFLNGGHRHANFFA